MIFLEKPQRGERNGAEARNWFCLYPPRWWQKRKDPRSSKKVRQNKMWPPLTLYHQGPSYHLESTVHHCDIKIILSRRHLSSWISFFLESRVSPKYMKVVKSSLSRSYQGSLILITGDRSFHTTWKRDCHKTTIYSSPIYSPNGQFALLQSHLFSSQCPALPPLSLLR